MIRYLFLASLLTLSACQSTHLAELDYQPGHNFTQVQSWQWAQPAIQFEPDTPAQNSDLDAQRVRQAIAEQLSQQGLCHSDNASIAVRAWLISESQQQRVDIQNSDYWGGAWGPRIRTESYEVTQQIQKLQIDILDSSTQTLLWRASDSWILPQQRISPAVRDAKLRAQVQHILQHFPPR